ncbi:phage holin family protein [Nitrosovibrio sp. Nv17]|jgi:putative membrane protein|uniref:phage holin family protein n=1 Tax=Nitrosovibrio sp. Nv17 TaxID=1855339 RepID=UPI0009089A5E|nr:phage holin family protein [Nitrosovibrio sp. Nv17]SFW35201.1 putative membrane protein [Nitrosovibrio sp. Nv17]
MLHDMMEFLAHCGITALSLWLASLVFHGVSFASRKSLLVSALLLGIANAVIKPVIIVLTIPLTLVTFGFFLLVINALMLLLVSTLVPGFRISGFWTAFFASILVTLLSLFAGAFLFDPNGYPADTALHQGVMI